MEPGKIKSWTVLSVVTYLRCLYQRLNTINQIAAKMPRLEIDHIQMNRGTEIVLRTLLTIVLSWGTFPPEKNSRLLWQQLQQTHFILATWGYLHWHWSQSVADYIKQIGSVFRLLWMVTNKFKNYQTLWVLNHTKFIYSTKQLNSWVVLMSNTTQITIFHFLNLSKTHKNGCKQAHKMLNNLIE